MSISHKSLLLALTCVVGAGLVATANAGASGVFMERAANSYQARGEFDYRDEGTAAAKGTAAGPVAVTRSGQSTTPQAQPRRYADIGQLKYKVGQLVEYVDYGKWYRAVIIEVRDNYAPYRVHPLGYGLSDLGGPVSEGYHWVPESYIRPAGSGPTEPVPGGEANDPVLKAMRGRTAATPTQPPAQPPAAAAVSGLRTVAGAGGCAGG